MISREKVRKSKKGWGKERYLYIILGILYIENEIK